MGEWPPYGGSHRDYIERESLEKLTLSLYHRDEGSYIFYRTAGTPYSYGAAAGQLLRLRTTYPLPYYCLCGHS